MALYKPEDCASSLVGRFAPDGAIHIPLVVINPEFEVSFTISDAAGRTVMSGKLDNYTGTANNLLTWSCQAHDTVTPVAGFGNCLESRSMVASLQMVPPIYCLSRHRPHQASRGRNRWWCCSNLQRDIARSSLSSNQSRVRSIVYDQRCCRSLSNER